MRQDMATVEDFGLADIAIEELNQVVNVSKQISKRSLGGFLRDVEGFFCALSKQSLVCRLFLLAKILR